MSAAAAAEPSSGSFMTRFIPESLSLEEGGARLRGVVVFLPDALCPADLARWPRFIADKMRSKRLQIGFAEIGKASDRTWEGEGGSWYPAQALHHTDYQPTGVDGPADAATQLWQALMAPDWHRAGATAQGILAHSLAEAGGRFNSQILAASEDPWGTLAAGLSGASAEGRRRSLLLSQAMRSAGDPAPESGPIRISSTPSKELDGVLGLFTGIRYLRSLPTRGGHLSPFERSTDVWGGAAALFEGELGPKRRDTDYVAFAADPTATVLSSLGRRGKAAGEAAAVARANGFSGDNDRKGEEAPAAFDRRPPPPRPEDRLTTKLEEMVLQARANDESRARTIYDARTSRSDSTSATLYGARLARPDADDELANWFGNQGAGILTTDGAVPRVPPPSAAIQEMFARHLLSLRPDPIVEHTSPLAWSDGSRALPSEAQAILDDYANVQQRRMFGILAYPALARALKLVVDVELILPADHPIVFAGGGAVSWFLAAASVGNPDPRLWTACKRRRLQLTAASLDEVRFRQGTPIDEDLTHVEGVWNLGARAGDKLRFSVTSIDVTSSAEQFLHRAQSTANSRRTGAPLEEGSPEAPTRGGGLTILDSMRAEAAQIEGADAEEQRSRLKQGLAVTLYADHLCVGYRLDVGVQRRTGVPGREWRSLGQRSVRFGPVQGRDGRTIDVETIVEGALKVAAPLVSGFRDARAFRDRLDESSIKLSARIIAEHKRRLGEGIEAAEAVAQQTLVQWEGDPLGAPCVAADPKEGLSGEVDPTRDLPLSVTIGLPQRDSGAKLPPRLEVGRAYHFAMRHAYLGGGGHSLDSAIEIYESADGAAPMLPPEPEGTRFRRPERVAGPVIAQLHRRGADAGLPGSSLTDIVVRSSASATLTTPLETRIVYAPSVPMAFAIQHPSLDEDSGMPTGKRVLDAAPVLDGRPLGGLINVQLNPDGGLPVRKGQIIDARAPVDGRQTPKVDLQEPPSEGVFRVLKTDRRPLEKRQAHYYPDPAVHSIIFELWTRGPGARPLPDTRVEVSIYDEDYLQAAPQDVAGMQGYVACEYPYAMPVLVEVTRGARRAVRCEPERDTGTLAENEGFKVLRSQRRPPEGSVTVRRLRIVLPPGDDLELRAWCWTPAQKLDWFRAFDEMVKALGIAAVGQSELTSQELAQAASDLFGPDIIFADTSSVDAVRRQIADWVAGQLATAPIPEQSEQLRCHLVHAVQRPLPPRWTTPGEATVAPAAGAGSPLTLLRRSIADRDWPGWLEKDSGDLAAWSRKHELGASTVWLGGGIEFDLKAADRLSLRAIYRDVRDTPGQPLPLKADASGRVQLDFPMAGPLEAPPAILDDDPYAQGAAERGRPLDLLRSQAGKARALKFMLPDHRAYELQVIPTASSRFIRLMKAPGSSGDEGDLFSAVGETKTIWAPATKRPAPMSHVELLPAFVWETREGGRRRDRTTVVRLSWRRPKKAAPGEAPTDSAMGAWYSSGAGERLGIVLMREPLGDGPRNTPPDTGRARPFLSAWGADPIRKSFNRPSWQFPPAIFDGNRDDVMEEVPEQWMPYPAEADQAEGSGGEVVASDFARLVDLRTFEPQYDPVQDAWYVDVRMDPGNVPSPWIQLGLVRYQRNAMRDRNMPTRDLCLSTPANVQFRLEPFRSVKVQALPRKKGERLWPVEIVVTGPLTFANGAAEYQIDAKRRQALSKLTRPRFKLSVLSDALRGDGAGEAVIFQADSDTSPPPCANELWRTTIYLERSPTWTPHFVFLEEVDPMMPANPTVGGPELVESGPRFMAKLRIRRA